MRQQTPFTPDEVAKLTKWLAEGHKARWIAAQFGRTLRSVQNRIRRQYLGMISAKRGGVAAKSKDEVIPCMCCRQPFKSWDRKRNRLCPNCGRDGVTRYDTSHATLRPPKGFRGE